jgi:hypothetical protein
VCERERRGDKYREGEEGRDIDISWEVREIEIEKGRE